MKEFERKSYSEQYELYKNTGAISPIIFHAYPMPTQEEWMIIPENILPGSNGRYSVSNFGNVLDNFEYKIKLQFTDKNGYCKIYLKGHNFAVHRLVLLVFDYRENHEELQVNHIDGNPSNNCIFNLEWVTGKENSDHAMLMKLHEMNGELNPNNKLSEKEVREICVLIESGKYFDTEIAKMYNVSCVTISDIHKGKIWKNIGREYNLSVRKYKSLNPEQVHEICKLLEERKLNLHEIGRMYNVAYQNIADIRDGVIWTEISKNYNISKEAMPIKFTEKEVREMCELIQSGKYFDTEIAKMYNTTPTYIRDLRKANIWKNVVCDYDLTVRKKRDYWRKPQ